ncbi:hypothetical protein GWI33_000748 [Rhynchophorus ferrugineus]|uniref:Uncharacterized protein n=1 Tax=Rhynchophorus ferrugineus TaxID=354439 RepID=A0A834HZ25_RHYFE|nr:hypothetical protein GWI33_000752 [Rhynchophorus ferrugineus]KAF7264031.1 hypothetical protein GWI33_000748 [Rhynchophorus ferrugineus]
MITSVITKRSTPNTSLINSRHNYTYYNGKYTSERYGDGTLESILAKQSDPFGAVIGAYLSVPSFASDRNRERCVRGGRYLTSLIEIARSYCFDLLVIV